MFLLFKSGMSYFVISAAFSHMAFKRAVYPVELGPGDGHVTVVFRDVTAAAKSLLCKENQVIL